MLTKKQEAPGLQPGGPPGPKSQPQATATEAIGLAHSDTESRKSRVLASRCGRDVVSDTVAWLLFTAIIVAIILSSCALAWLAWPAVTP
jgi:hypothetical protein